MIAMHFLYPWMFWCLLALAIPITIHLFNFRRHKLVYFSNTALLRAIQQENAKTRKLKYLVALCLRCLFFIALVFAFAFPYFSEKSLNVDADNNLVGIYIDNSMSMKTQSSRLTLMADARESASKLVGRLSPSNRYVLLTNSFEKQNEYPMNQEEMLERIVRMNEDGHPVSLKSVIGRFEMLRHQHGFSKSMLFVYSDFQDNMLDMSDAKADTSMQVVLVPMSSEFNSNVYIDSLWTSSPIMQIGLANDLKVRVVNQNGRDMKGIPVTFTMDDRTVASATTDIEKNGTAELTMQFMVEDPGNKKCSVSLTDYPITFDDQYYFVFEVKPALKVVEIGEEPSPASMVFDEDSQFEYQFMKSTQMDLNALSDARFVIVNESSSINETMQQKLLDLVSDGTSLAVFPSVDEPKSLSYLYNRLGLVASDVDTNAVATENLALHHGFFDDMILEMPQNADLPKVSRHLSMSSAGLASVLMTLQNNDPLLLSETVGNGQVFVFTTALATNWSTVSDNSLFVPVMLKMALIGGKVGRLSYTLGDDDVIVLSDKIVEGDNLLKIKKEDSDFEMIPTSEMHDNRMSLYLNDGLPSAGYYDLMLNDTVLHVLAWNENRSESKMEFADAESVRQSFEDAGLDVVAVLDAADFNTNNVMQAMLRQSTMWRWFVLLALVALLGEVAVLRFWKN